MLVKILKFFAGLFGSLLFAIGLMSGFLYFMANNLVNNADSFDRVISDASTQFLEENRNELRDLVKSKIEGQPLPKKEDLAFGCQNPNLIPEQFKEFLSQGFCSNLGSMPQEEVDNKVFDYLIDTNINGLMVAASSPESTQEVKDQIREMGGSLVNPTILIGPLIMVFAGAMLVFASVGFSFLRGAYKIISKAAVVFVTILIFILVVKYLPIDYFTSFLVLLQDALNVQLPSLVPIMLKFIVTIVINWIRLAISPLLPWAASIAAPLLALSIFLYFKQRSLSVEAKEEAKKKDEAALVKA